MLGIVAVEVDVVVVVVAATRAQMMVTWARSEGGSLENGGWKWWAMRYVKLESVGCGEKCWQPASEILDQS